MSKNTLLYLNRSDVEEINIPMTEIIDALEKMFLEKGEGKVEMPPKPGIHTRPDSFIHAMPAYIPGAGAAGLAGPARGGPLPRAPGGEPPPGGAPGLRGIRRNAPARW